MAGLAPQHIRILCDNPWDGGGGYTPEQVGNMTLDQIFMRLADRKSLRRDDGGVRTAQTVPGNAVRLADEDGLVRGRAADGTPMRARVGGKSKAQMIREEMEKSGK